MAQSKYDHLKRTEIGEVRVQYNPNVIVEKLMVANVLDTRTGNSKIDFRVWLDSNLGRKPFKGFTQRGFRLNREQYIEFRKLIPQIDAFLKLTKKELKGETD